MPRKAGRSKKYRRFPSQVRYDQKHPIVTFRVSQEEKELIQSLAKERGVRTGVLMKEALGTIKKDVKEYQRGFNAGRTKGIKEGYNTAKKEYRIWYFCNGCGEAITVLPNSESHKAMIEYMEVYGWAHAECHRLLRR